MKIIKGNKTEEMSKQNFDLLKGGYQKVFIDLGTGDGRFVYKSALAEPNTLFIGIDPNEND